MMILSSLIFVFILGVCCILIYHVFKNNKTDLNKNICTCEDHYEKLLIVSLKDFSNHYLRTTVVDFSDYDKDISGAIVICDECRKSKLFYGDSSSGYYGKVRKLSSLLEEYNKSEDKLISKVYEAVKLSGLEIKNIRVGDRRDKKSISK